MFGVENVRRQLVGFPPWALSGVILLLLSGFLRGWLEIGITQWALGGRLLGSVAGLSFGRLLICRKHRHPRVAASNRKLDFHRYHGRAVSSYPKLAATLGVESFAFQLLVVMALLLGY